MTLADIRLDQATRLWDLGYGTALGYDDFKKYLASIPELPKKPEKLPEHFQLILVDARIERSVDNGGLVAVCKLTDVVFDGDNNTFRNLFPERAIKEDVYWMWCQDGAFNRGRSPNICLMLFRENSETGLTAMEGLALVAQKPTLHVGHLVDLPGSFSSDKPRIMARIVRYGGRPQLYQGESTVCILRGSASRLIAD